MSSDKLSEFNTVEGIEMHAGMVVWVWDDLFDPPKINAYKLARISGHDRHGVLRIEPVGSGRLRFCEACDCYADPNRAMADGPPPDPDWDALQPASEGDQHE